MVTKIYTVAVLINIGMATILSTCKIFGWDRHPLDIEIRKIILPVGKALTLILVTL